jgi:hypothetical protein
MKFNTEKYTIRKLDTEEFSTAKYEIDLNEGYVFSDGSHLEYAGSYKELLEVLADIEEERA